MAVSTTRMSSKGQVVIPEDIRKKLRLKTGANFVVLGEGNTVVLKVVAPPSVDDLHELLQSASKQAKEAGLTKSKLRKIISDTRRRK